MNVITRKEASSICEDYRQIFEMEKHHNHEVVMTENGILRWKENPDVINMVRKIGLNDIVALFYTLGIDKNNEIHRKLFRDIGYSLSGYWEVFYWTVNNEYAEEYRQDND